MELVVGDHVLEVSRFNKNDYRLYKILSINAEGGVVLQSVKSSGTAQVKDGYTCTGEYECFFGHGNCKWLNYFLPTAKVLYG